MSDQTELTALYDNMEIRKAALVIRALNNKLRRRILEELESSGESIVGAIQNKLNIIQPVASQHLAILRHARIVKARREGKQIFYSVNRERLNQIIPLIQQLNK